MLLTTVISCGTSEGDGTIHPDLKLFQLQGNVKRMSYEECKIPEPLIASNIDIGIYTFDEDGTWLGFYPPRNEKGYIETVFADVYGDGNTDYYFEWNEKGQVISKKLRLRNDTEIVIDKYEYFYDGERLDSVAYETRAGRGATSYRFIDYDSWEKDEHGNWTTAKVEETTYWYTSGAEDKRMFYIKRNIEYWEPKSEYSEVEGFVTDFYNECVYKTYDEEKELNAKLRKACTPKLLKWLKKRYYDDCEYFGYDEYEGMHSNRQEEHYAIFEFEAMEPGADSGSDIRKLIDVKDIGNSWYTVNHVWYGIVTSKNIKVVEIDGKYMIDEVEETFDYEY